MSASAMSSGASTKPGNVIAVLFPEKVMLGEGVRFVVWVPAHIAMKAAVKELGALAHKLEAFPLPKLAASGMIRGNDSDYYCLIDLLDASQEEVGRATAAFANIFEQAFHIEPSVLPHAGHASLRIFERRIGLESQTFPIQMALCGPTLH